MKRALFAALVALSLAAGAQVGYSAGSQSQLVAIHRLFQQQEHQLQALRADVTALVEQSTSRVAAPAPVRLSTETQRPIPSNVTLLPPSGRASTQIPEAVWATSENIAAHMEASHLIEAAVSAGQWTESDASQLRQLFQNTTTGDRRALIKKLSVAINGGTMKVLVKGRMY